MSPVITKLPTLQVWRVCGWWYISNVLHAGGDVSDILLIGNIAILGD